MLPWAKAFGPRMPLSHPFVGLFVGIQPQHRQQHGQVPCLPEGPAATCQVPAPPELFTDPPRAPWLPSIAKQTEAWGVDLLGAGQGQKSVQIWASVSRPECHHCLSQTQLLVENEMGVNRPL